MSHSTSSSLAAEAFRSGSGLQVILDDRGSILLANDHWRRFAETHRGTAGAHLATMNYFAVCRQAAADGEADAANVLAACEAVLRGGQSRRVEYSCRPVGDASGTPEFWYTLHVSALSGNRLLLEHVDVTTQQSALQRAVQESSRASFEQLVLQAVAQPVIATDLTGHVTYWNAAAEELFGYTSAEALGRLITEVTVPETSLEQAEEIMASLARGERWTGEFWVQHRDGTRFPARVTDIPMLDATGQIIGIVGVSDDLRPQYERERQQEKLRVLEAQLLQRQKLEALGTIAGGVAHEFNNVLAAILGNAELLRDGGVAHDDGRAAADNIVEATQRARDIVYALLTFSRPQSTERHPVDAERWLRSAMRLVEPSVSTDVKFNVEWLAPPTTILANETQLTQVLLNLASNASHAMRHQPRRELHIRGTREHGAPTPDSPAGEWFVLEVADTGAGMEESVRARVFDPFFTTKPPGEGTGLGLAMVLGLVTAHEGHIEVDSAPSRGTRVRVKLPVTESSARTSSPELPRPTPTLHGHVLLVDDDAMVLRALSRVLEAAGFTVSAFTDPRHALRFVELTPVAKQMTVAVIDYAMPGLRGDELADLIAQHGAGLPVLLCTGNATDIQTMPPNVRGVIEKPVTGAALVAAIAEVGASGARVGAPGVTAK